MILATVSKKIVLKSWNGEPVEIDEAVAFESHTIKHIIEDDCASNRIPLPNFTSKILSKVIEYYKQHVEAKAAAEAGDKDITVSTEDEELKKWDAEFVLVDQPTLFDIIMAANYLDIPGLFGLTCKTVADMMKGKTPEQMRERFNIKNDYSPEEEAEIHKDIQWAFE